MFSEAFTVDSTKRIDIKINKIVKMMAKIHNIEEI